MRLVYVCRNSGCWNSGCLPIISAETLGPNSICLTSSTNGRSRASVVFLYKSRVHIELIQCTYTHIHVSRYHFLPSVPVFCGHGCRSHFWRCFWPIFLSPSHFIVLDLCRRVTQVCLGRSSGNFHTNTAVSSLHPRNYSPLHYFTNGHKNENGTVAE